MAAAPNRNQHWVPQFYLRYFATPETRDSDHPQIWAFPISEGDEFKSRTRNVAAERDLYAYCGAEVDDRLQELESLLARQWPKFAHDHYALDETFKMALGLFISTLYLRHPLERQRERHYHDLYRIIAQEAPGGDTPPNIVSITIGDRTIKAGRQAVEELAVRSEQEVLKTWGATILTISGRLAEHLLQQPWSMLFPTEPSFVTSDNPIALYHPDAAKPGLRMPGTVLYFPISPTRLLVIGKSSLQDEYAYPVLRHGEDLFNYQIFCAAYRHVFSPWNPARLLTQVIKVDEWANERRRSMLQTIRGASFGRVGRNQPCPCGSGKKFKQCCGL